MFADPPEGESAVDRLLGRAEAEVGAGRPWRAKEILSGAMRMFATDVRLLESYGRLLDQLGDRVEAGKYLFLSGVRDSDTEEAIELFLARHGKGHLSNLVSRFPRRIRSRSLSELPPVVEADMMALGLPESPPREKPLHEVVSPPTWKQTAGLFGCAVAGAGLFATSVVGLVVIVRWVLRLVVG